MTAPPAGLEFSNDASPLAGAAKLQYWYRELGVG
jgi:hypothetical protein